MATFKPGGRAAADLRTERDHCAFGIAHLTLSRLSVRELEVIADIATRRAALLRRRGEVAKLERALRVAA